MSRSRLTCFLFVLSLLTVAAAFAGVAAADPSHNIGPSQTVSCDNGETVVVNPGTLTNQGHVGFVVGSTSVFVVNYLAYTDSTGTFVFFETAPGLTAQGLLICSGDAGGGFTVTVRGFFT